MSGKPAVSIMVLWLLLFLAWLPALLQWANVPPRTNNQWRINEGKTSTLAEPIRLAPRALVYVDAPWSMDARRGRQLFIDATRQLSAEHSSLGIQFFLLDDENADDFKEWVSSKEKGIGVLGTPVGCGGLVWLERGRVMTFNEWGGRLSTGNEIVKRTLEIWQKRGW
jgi:hypothetical protein